MNPAGSPSLRCRPCPQADSAMVTSAVLSPALAHAGEAASIVAAAATRGRVLPRDAGVVAVEELLERWRRRWPSDALDPPEVWERVVSLRKIALEALHVLAPPAVAGSPAARLVHSLGFRVYSLDSSRGRVYN